MSRGGGKELEKGGKDDSRGKGGTELEKGKEGKMLGVGKRERKTLGTFPFGSLNYLYVSRKKLRNPKIRTVDFSELTN